MSPLPWQKPSLNSPPADEPESKPGGLQVLKEIITAIIAMILVIGFVVLMVAAFWKVNKDVTDALFTRVKDLLAIATPIVSVVLGYYFGKTSGEGRADAAERTANAAKRGEESTAERAWKARGALHGMLTAAEDVLQKLPARAALADAPEAAPLQRLDFEARRARDVLDEF